QGRFSRSAGAGNQQERLAAAGRVRQFVDRPQDLAIAAAIDIGVPGIEWLQAAERRALLLAPPESYLPNGLLYTAPQTVLDLLFECADPPEARDDPDDPLVSQLEVPPEEVFEALPLAIGLVACGLVVDGDRGDDVFAENEDFGAVFVCFAGLQGRQNFVR